MDPAFASLAICIVSLAICFVAVERSQVFQAKKPVASATATFAQTDPSMHIRPS
jgi:uncharacterized membrane protein